MTLATAPLAELEGIPYVPWDVFLRDHFRWEQGEHLTCIGPTGCGKTTVQLALMPMRRYVVVLGTKPGDRTLEQLHDTQGYTRAYQWREVRKPRAGRTSRWLLWPRFRGPSDFAVQAEVFDQAFGHIFAEGGWTVCADELWYLCHKLGLTEWLEIFWTQARSQHISLMGGTQRPSGIPLFAYSAATHLFLWRDNDERNLERVGGIGGLSAKQIRATVAALPKHYCLYVNTRDGQMVITRAV